MSEGTVREEFLDQELKDNLAAAKVALRSNSKNSLESDESSSNQADSIHESDVNKKNGKKCCKLNLREGVSPLNVFSYIFGFGCNILYMALTITFTSYLLADHYGVEDSDAAALLGEIGFVAEFASLFCSLFLGFVMDFMGRKWPCVIGLFLAGCSFVSSPLPNKVQWLYFFRILGNIGVLPTIYSPL